MGYTYGNGASACNTHAAPNHRPASPGATAMAHSKPVPRLTPAQEERFWSKVEVHQPSGCWEWTGSILRSGYGQFSVASFGSFLPHRVAFHLLVGEVSPDLDVDHLCRNPRCVNPDHLQLVTKRVNTLRGYGPSSENAKKTHCKNGHEFTPENTFYFPSQKGKRTCRTCWQEISRSDRSRARRCVYMRSERGKEISRQAGARYRAKKRAERECANG